MCVARAIFKASEIVIMDKATALIDDGTGLRSQQCIRSMIATVIIIVPRLRTIVYHDKIMLLEGG